jgi:hypothetical protein
LVFTISRFFFLFLYRKLETNMKICKKCGEQKELSEFIKHNNKCKSCIKEYQDIYREANKEKHKKWREANKDALKIYQKEKNRKWYEKNKESQRKKHKEYRKKNRKQKNKYLRNYIKERRKNSPSFRLSCNQRAIIKESLKTKGLYKSNVHHKLLGCTSECLFLHIENQFSEWMDWSNYGKYNGNYFYGWDVDHIRPLSSFDLSILSQQKIAFSYKNLTPLCSRKNRHDKRAFLFSDWIEDKPFYFFDLSSDKNITKKQP